MVDREEVGTPAREAHSVDLAPVTRDNTLHDVARVTETLVRTAHAVDLLPVTCTVVPATFHVVVRVWVT